MIPSFIRQGGSWHSVCQASESSMVPRVRVTLAPIGASAFGYLISKKQAIDASIAKHGAYEKLSIPSGIQIADECIHVMHNLRSRKSAAQKLRFIIFKVADDNQSVVVEETSSEPEYEVFRQKLCSTQESSSAALPRFAAYDVEYDLGQDGKRSKVVFISWVPENTPLKLCMMYASCKEQLRRALDIGIFIHADSTDEIEWEDVLKQASGGRM